MSHVALVHEWFTALAGSEKVVEQLCAIFPRADLFAVYADPATVGSTSYLSQRCLQTSFIQHLPRASQAFRSYLLLMPLAIEQFDLSRYEVVISSNHAVAKGVLTGPDQMHISYVHSPIHYAWDLQHQYLRESGLDRGPLGWVAKWMLHSMRIWDYRTAAGVDHFVANSAFIARRIHKVYGRRAHVIYPPVDVTSFSAVEHKEAFYLTASRLVPYKKMDLIVEAFSAMPEKQLVVVGDGPERAKVQARAGRNIQLLGHQPLPVLKELMQRARLRVRRRGRLRDHAGGGTGLRHAGDRLWKGRRARDHTRARWSRTDRPLLCPTGRAELGRGRTHVRATPARARAAALSRERRTLFQ